MKVTRGRRVYLLLILDLGTRWGKMISVTPGHALLLRKGPTILNGQEAGWATELVWTERLEEKFFFTFAGDRIPFVQTVVRHYID
jgi:hypothetical protein